MSFVNIVPIPLLSPVEIEKSLKPAIEMTGYGDLLCYDGLFGRWFRCSEEHVRKAVDEYVNEYMQGFYLSYNELYEKFPIAKTLIGNEFGYAPDEDYKVDMQFDITLVPEDENFEGRGEQVLVIEPSYGSYPIDCYMEV